MTAREWEVWDAANGRPLNVRPVPAGENGRDDAGRAGRPRRKVASVAAQSSVSSGDARGRIQAGSGAPVMGRVDPAPSPAPNTTEQTR